MASESYQNAQGERITDTQWHQVVAWGKLAGIAAQQLSKGRAVKRAMHTSTGSAQAC